MPRRRISKQSDRAQGLGQASVQRGNPLTLPNPTESSAQDFWAAAEVHASAFYPKGTQLSYTIAKVARFNDIVRSSDLRTSNDSIFGRQGR